MIPMTDKDPRYSANYPTISKILEKFRQIDLWDKTTEIAPISEEHFITTEVIRDGYSWREITGAVFIDLTSAFWHCLVWRPDPPWVQRGIYLLASILSQRIRRVVLRLDLPDLRIVLFGWKFRRGHYRAQNYTSSIPMICQHLLEPSWRYMPSISENIRPRPTNVWFARCSTTPPLETWELGFQVETGNKLW